MAVEALLHVQRLPWFSDLVAEDVQALVQAGRTLSVGSGEVVFREGDPGDTLYVILSGTVRVSHTNEQGQEVELATLKAGGIFGELALIDGEPRSAGVSTLEPCQLFLLGRDDFLRLLSQSPRMLTDFLAGLSTKIRQANAQFFELILQKERLRAQTEIERHRSIAQMVAGVAHELNTPIGIANQAASIFTERLTPATIAALARDDSAKALCDDLVQAASLIQANLARADRLITSFKHLSARQLTDVKETVDLCQLTEEIAGLYKLRARQSKLQVEITNQLGTASAEWIGYPGYFSQILLNLLTNIERYAYPEGMGGKVDIVVARDPNAGKTPHFSVVVRDFGRGIPRADQSKLFEPFFTTGRASGGTGLGLAIVHNLVTSALEGTIRIDSELGKGTAVVMSFPVQVVGGESDDQR
jgi:signal transduction histidine kinase